MPLLLTKTSKNANLSSTPSRRLAPSFIFIFLFVFVLVHFLLTDFSLLSLCNVKFYFLLHDNFDIFLLKSPYQL